MEVLDPLLFGVGCGFIDCLAESGASRSAIGAGNGTCETSERQ